MIRYWASRPQVRSTADDLRSLSLGVLSKAGFGKSFKFQGYEETSHANPDENYKDCLQLILEYCILIIAMGPKFFTKMPWLPGRFKKIGRAVSAFQLFMTEMYETEKKRVSQGLSGTGSNRTFLSSLAKASLEAKEGEGLTEREIWQYFCHQLCWPRHFFTRVHIRCLLSGRQSGSSRLAFRRAGPCPWQAATY